MRQIYYREHYNLEKLYREKAADLTIENSLEKTQKKQELLNNIIKHSKATQAIVQMSVNGSALSITVEDNGIGFSSQKFEGMGIKSVKSRISALNGKMEMETGPGNGVSAYLEFDTTGLEVTGRMPVS